MAIKPIDFQMSIPKSFEASKNQQNHLRSADVAAQQQALSNQENALKKLQTVKDSEKSEKKDLRNDDDGQQKNQQEREEKEKNDQQNNASKDIEFIPGKIDIKI